MGFSPLPSRTRPGLVSATLSKTKNPFSIAAAVSSSAASSKSGRSKAADRNAQSSKVAKNKRFHSQRSEDISEDESDNDYEASAGENEEEEEDEEEGDEESDEEDELATVGGLASSPYFTQPTQAVTQPTQLVKTTKQPAGTEAAISILSSSPPKRSIIEVPASSPPSASNKSRVASLMAPAGTIYRAPVPAPQTSSSRVARGQKNYKDGRFRDDVDDLDDVVRIEDSSDDGQTPSRGDIRPASFKSLPLASASEATAKTAGNTRRHAVDADDKKEQPSSSENTTTAAQNHHKVPNDRRIERLVLKMKSQLRNKGGMEVASETCRRALISHNYNMQSAVANVLDDRSAAGSSPPPKTNITAMLKAYTYKGDASNGGISAGASSPIALSASQQSQSSQKKRTLSPSPRPKRRRLVQGRKHHAPSSSPVIERGSRSIVDLVADDDNENDDDDESMGDGDPAVLLSDDNEDELAMSDVHEGSDDEETRGSEGMDDERRVLEYLNTCTADDLVAMLGGRARSKADMILSHRPFRSQAAVLRVSNQGKGKRGKQNFGEDIYFAVEEYVKALQAIDKVVAKCEQMGLRIRSTLHRWNIDFRGSSKRGEPGDSNGNSTANGKQPLTPISDSDGAGKGGDGYVALPIPQEPELMQGHCSMKGYQLFGLNWLWELYQRRFGCILADDMGLGKTCQVISFLSQLIGNYVENGQDGDDAPPWPNLVIVPPSTLANWKAEFEKFAPDIRVTTYSGSVAERDEIYYDIQEDRTQHHVVLTSYSQLSGKHDLDAMRKLSPHVAIFDEGHKMKNANTILYQSLRRITAEWRLILTGTPVQNNLMEMINLLNFIQPELFEKHIEKLGVLFKQKFTLQDVSNGALLFSDRVRRARSILEPFILQRRKEQVLLSMPPKTTRVVYCDLDETQEPIYKKYEQQFKDGKNKTAQAAAAAAVAKAAKTRSVVTGLSDDQNNVWVQLRKSAIHAQLFRRYYDDKKVEKMAKVLMARVPQTELRQPELKHLINELRDCSDFELHTWCRDYPCIRQFDIPDSLWLRSGKVKALLELIERFRANGDRALVFTRFARVLNILRECLTFKKIDYVSLEGATRVEERQAIIDEFNSNENIAVFLLTTGSGGTGINLTSANKVVIFDQSDNPQDDVQAENRAHRLGQTREVEVIKLVTRDTIEELVYKACQTKLELAQRVTAGSSSNTSLDAYSDMDGDKVAKAVEEEVRKMLLAKTDGATPPESNDENMSD